MTSVCRAKTTEPIEMGHTVSCAGIKKPRGCTFALPDKYDGSICAAAVMRPAAIVTLAASFNMIPIDSKKANALAALP